MLDDPDPEVQMRALAEIGQAYFRRAVAREPAKKVFLAEAEDIARISGWIPETSLTVSHVPWKLSESLRAAIFEKLKSEKAEIRAEAALALVHWHDEETVQKLVQSLKDPERIVRLAGIQALFTMKESAIIPHLLDVAEKDSDELVQAYALNALEGLLRAEVKAEEEKPPTAVLTAGPIRNRGTAKQDLLERLEKIGKATSSPFVAALVARAREQLLG